MKHIIGGMDATKEFIFKAFMCFRCTFKAFGVILWHFKVVQMNQGILFSFFLLFLGAQIIAPPGVILRARWRPLNQKACSILYLGVKHFFEL
jgi:hypothetical protein